LSIFLMTGVALGDYCFNQQGVSIRIALQGNQIHVNASAAAAWVGVGVPKSPTFTEMARGNFVIGGAGGVYDNKLEMDYNWKPDKLIRTVVNGSASVRTVGQMTSLSFSRLLQPVGQNPINASAPFNLLWAYGALKPNLQGYAALDYHQTNRGHIVVDLVKGNCSPAPTPKPAPTVGTAGKNGKNGKTGVACAAGRSPCTVKLQQGGQNCVLGACVIVRTSNSSVVCAPGRSPCTAKLQQEGQNCVLGACGIVNTSNHAANVSSVKGK